MIAIFFVGYALLTILSGALSYDISNFELFGVAVVTFILYKLLIEKKRVLFWLAIVVIVSSGIGSYYLYRIKMLSDVYHTIVNFLSPFYYSLVVKSYYIGRLHQFIMMFILGFVVYILFSNFYYIRRLRFLSPLFGLIAIIIAFLIGTFSGITDRNAFFIYILSTFLYYYEIYYISLEDSSIHKQRASFYVLGTTMAIVVILSGTIGDSFWHNPFERKIRVVSQSTDNTALDTTTPSETKIRELVYELPKDYTVQSTFSHQGIELFKIRANTLKYFKVQTFGAYENGTWVDLQKNYISQQQWPIEPIFSQNYSSDSFFDESIEVVYQNVTTDSLLVAPFTKNIRFSEDNFRLNVEEDGAILSDTMLVKGFTYTMDVLIPKYGTTALNEYLDNNSIENDDVNGSVVDSVDVEELSAFPEGYEDIANLSDRITKGITTDLGKAKAIETFLRTEYQYSETPEFKEGEDYIEQFLFDKKVGFCQQFASSMVLMLRAQGIPSRFVVGYVAPDIVDEFDSIPEEILYREQMEKDPYKHVYDSNAHAWVEVYSEGTGWIQFEPTPSQSLVQFYDPVDTSVELSEQEASIALERINRQEVILASSIAVGILIFGFISYKIISRFVKNYKNTYLRFVRTYRSILRYLDAAQLGKEKSQTLREYNDFLERKLINTQLRFRNFLALLEDAFYNQGEPSEDEVKEFELYFQEIRKFAKRNLQSHRYNRLRFYDFIVVFRGK